MKHMLFVLIVAASAFAAECAGSGSSAMSDIEWLDKHAQDPLPALHQAAKVGDVAECRRLLEAGADVNAPSIPAQEGDEIGFGETPLMLAAQNGHAEVCNLLLAAGAEPDASTRYEWETPLMLAASFGHVDICRSLLAAGANVDACGRTISSPLSQAARHGHVEVCRLLLAAGANVDMIDRFSRSALDSAIGSQEDVAPQVREQVASLLLAAGADPNYGLATAVQCGNRELSRMLLAAGADKNFRLNDEAESPLEVAQESGDAAMAKLVSEWEGVGAPFPQENVSVLHSPLDEMETSLVIWNPAKQQLLVYGDQGAQRRSPCSTFKIVASLLAMEHGVLDPQNSMKKWSGKQYRTPEWNQDMDFETAFRNSCVWYFRELIDELTNKIGADELAESLAWLSYGNADISDFGGELSAHTDDPTLKGFWLMSSLLISPAEQVGVMERIFGEKSAFSLDSVAALKRVMLVDEDAEAGMRIYGKTGTGGMGPHASMGWFAGFAETKEGHVYFCVYAKRLGEEEISGPLVRELALPLLKRCARGELKAESAASTADE